MLRKYESPAATARRWGISRSLVSRWLNEGLVRGAAKKTDSLGREYWEVPTAARKPKPRKPGPKPKAAT